MLDEMTPEQMDGWYAAYLLDPWDDGWRQAALIAAKVHNGSLLVTGSNGVNISQKEFVEAEDLIPKPVFGAAAKKRRRKSRATLTTTETEVALRSKFGG